MITGPRWELAQDDKRYPETLRLIADAPVRLYGIGSSDILSSAALAIIGARKATPYGISCARHFARQAARAGIIIVSGGAIGCDQAAHEGALSQVSPPEGSTVVVLGCGADVVYPSRAGTLFQRIVDTGGTLISERPWGSPPARWAFPARNRIIAGLARAVLIVEAGLPSGTFSTADAALGQGKDVLVIPGSVFSKESCGSNRLIAQGATPIVDDESFEDALMLIYGALCMKGDCGNTSDPADALKELCVAKGSVDLLPLVSALAAKPSRPEELLGTGGSSISEVVRNISRLELDGVVVCYRDGRYGVRGRWGAE